MLDCQSCGACCRAIAGYNLNYVPVTRDDANRLSREQRKQYLLPMVGNRSAMLLTKSSDSTPVLTCKALQGMIGASVSCQVYENRPDVCRRFEPGDHVCDFARSEAGLSGFR